MSKDSKTALAIVILILILLVSLKILNKKTDAPDEKLFIKNRIDCTNKELDIRQVYAHLPQRPEEGINVFERPSLNLQLIHHIVMSKNGGKIKNEKFFRVKNGSTIELSFQGFTREQILNFPIAQIMKFRSQTWRACLKNVGIRRSVVTTHYTQHR